MSLIGDNRFFDLDLPFLSDTLALLDAQLAELGTQIEASPDPDGHGLFDSAEYTTGLAFVLCQRYMTATCGPNIDKAAALALPPIHPGGKSIAQLINAAANAWKHSDEWPYDASTTAAKRTIEVIETVTPYTEYVAYSLLYRLNEEPASLTKLLPLLEEWHDNVVAYSLANREQVA